MILKEYAIIGTVGTISHGEAILFAERFYETLRKKKEALMYEVFHESRLEFYKILKDGKAGRKLEQIISYHNLDDDSKSRIRQSIEFIEKSNFSDFIAALRAWNIQFHGNYKLRLKIRREN